MAEIGRETGCHTCGNTELGTKSGNRIPDHQPAKAPQSNLWAATTISAMLTCSRIQGGQVRGATRRNQ